MNNIKKYLKIARFDHWIKQLFILPGVGLAQVMTTKSERPFLLVFLGLLATSFAASANYVINEWLDAEFDKYHPVKKYRPCVTDGLKRNIVYLEYATFLVLSLIYSSLRNFLTTV